MFSRYGVNYLIQLHEARAKAPQRLDGLRHEGRAAPKKSACS